MIWHQWQLLDIPMWIVVTANTFSVIANRSQPICAAPICSLRALSRWKSFLARAPTCYLELNKQSINLLHTFTPTTITGLEILALAWLVVLFPFQPVLRTIYGYLKFAIQTIPMKHPHLLLPILYIADYPLRQEKRSKRCYLLELSLKR